MHVPPEPRTPWSASSSDDDLPAVTPPPTREQLLDWVHDAVRSGASSDTVIARLMQHGFSLEEASDRFDSARAGRAIDAKLRARDDVPPPSTLRHRAYLVPLSLGVITLSFAAFAWLGSYTAAANTDDGLYVIPTGLLIFGTLMVFIGLCRVVARLRR